MTMNSSKATSVFLIIDDQKSIALLLQQKLQAACSVDVMTCHSLAEAKSVLENDKFKVEVCLCDMNLPDAPRGETIDLLLAQKITTVVLSGSFNEETRQEVLDKGVADFVLKDSPAAINYAIKVLINLYKNAQRSIWLITSGQSDYANTLANFLKLHRYQVKELSSLPKLQEIQQLKKLPSMMIFEDSAHIGSRNVMKFISQLRDYYNPHQLPIIACEPDASISVAIQIMKNGANDFFNTAINPEGLSARLRQDIELSESYRAVEYISQRDSLTGLYNRRFFFELGENLLNECRKEKVGFFNLMIDIDHFKNVNDSYGHQKGDEVITYVSRMIESLFDQAIVGRFGGEEFSVFGKMQGNLDSIEKVHARAELLRKSIETQADIDTGIFFTLSAGLCFHGQDLEHIISIADKSLYVSKENGRNRVTLCNPHS